MSSPSERILLVESNPEIIDLIVQQVLEPMGFQVELAANATVGIEKAIQNPPDLLIVNLMLSDLSGKDLLVALRSQGMNIPALVIAGEGMENDIVQAVRLGASDYLSVPIREAELVSVLERVLGQIYAARKRENLAAELVQKNKELERRLRDLSALCWFGRIMTSLKDEKTLHNKILEAAVYITKSERGWLLLKRGKGELFLSATHNLPESFLPQNDQTWEDGLSTLAALSGESLSIYGESLSRFKVSKLGQAAIVAPVKSNEGTIGVIVMMRKTNRPFSAHKLRMLEAVADFATIGLMYVDSAKALQDYSHAIQNAEDVTNGVEIENGESVIELSPDLRKELVLANAYIGMLVDGQLGKLDEEQADVLQIVKEKLQSVVRQLETGANSEEVE